MRLSIRSEQIAAESVDKTEKRTSASQANRKRQRRLTNHQRGANASLQVLKNAADLLQQPAPAVKADKCRKKAAAAPAPRQKPVDKLPHDAFMDLVGYISSEDNRKMAPGKRIKWRTAIPEEDQIRQNLTDAFLEIPLKNVLLTTAANSSIPSAHKTTSARRKRT